MVGSAAQLRCGGRTLELEAAVVMGVLNVTPDSFSDGGLYRAPGAALGRAEQMVEEGATIVDVGALRVPGALEAAAAGNLGVCLMHMRGEPPDMQRDPVYGDVVAEIREFLQERVRACGEAGIERERLCLDPGF